MSTLHIIMYVTSFVLFVAKGFNTSIVVNLKPLDLFALAFAPLVVTLLW